MSVWFSPSETHGFARLRAGWRAAIYAAVVSAPVVIARFAVPRPAAAAAATPIPPIGMIVGEVIPLLWVTLITWILARLEHQPLGHYGLPGRSAFGARFWQGVIWGAVSLTVLLLLILASGDYGFGAVATHGGSLARYAVVWAIAFLAVGFFEEFCFRGYALITLREGAGFWTAALILSAAFGAVHLGNGGEDFMGALSAGLIGLFLCFTWLRTGSLWFAVGFHAAWDYCESFVYGVPDSGAVSPGRLLAPSFHGSRWITGGSVGPEGSLWILLVIAALFVLFAIAFPSPGRLEHHAAAAS